MIASAYKRLVALFIFSALLIVASVLLLLRGHFEQSSAEVVESWFTNEFVALQQGNILSSVTKLQRTIDHSALINSAAVVSSDNRILAQIGDVPKAIQFSKENLELRSRRTGLFQSEFSFGNGQARVVIFAGSPSLRYISLVLALFFIGLLFSVGYLVRKLVVSQEQLRTSMQLSEMRSRVAVAEAVELLAKQVAHDIRAPVSALKMAIFGVELSGERREIVASATERINAIAEELLSSSTIDKRTRTSSFQFSRVVKQVASEHRLLNKDIKLRVGGPLADDLAVGDGQAFARVLSNLLTNAFEAADPNRPLEVDLRWSHSASEVSLLIEDNGIGMESRELSAIQTRGYVSRKPGGHGLGLPGARSELAKWGGSLRIHSQIGRGTRVEVNLPLAVGLEKH